MGIADDITESWGWLGIECAHVLRLNKFGNVIFADRSGKYWRLCPEELQCELIAESATAYERLTHDPEFSSDWEMARLVELAETKHGTLPTGRCFCLKTPGILGGAYDLENIGTISIGELIRFSGHVACQIKNLPPGSKVQFKVVD